MFDDIDPRSPTPLYEQIAARIRLAVAAEEVEPGDSLPSVRKLAGELRVNPATVVQAYRDLEDDGFVTTKRGAGTFVSRVEPAKREEERESQARALVRELIADAARLGIGITELAQALRDELGDRLDD